MKTTFYSRLVNALFLFMVTIVFSQDIQGTYAIENLETGKVLRIKDANRSEGTPLVLYSPVNWKCVTWDFKHVEGDYYRLKIYLLIKNSSHQDQIQKLGIGLNKGN